MINSASELSRTNLASVAKVTMGWWVMLVSFLAFQAASKWIVAFELQKKKGTKRKRSDSVNDSGGSSLIKALVRAKYRGEGGKLGLTGDRTVGNLMEQSLLFLPALWLHAVLVTPEGAVFWGWRWLAARSIYPVAFYCGIPWLFLSTIPAYVCLGALAAPLMPWQL